MFLSTFLLPLFLLIALCSSESPTNNNSSTILVNTSYGKLQGFSQPLSDSKTTMDIFLGVPYAQSPKGELRFEKPLSPLNWEGIHLANQRGPSCIPHARPEGLDPVWGVSGAEFSEDCLFLDLFAPHRDKKDGSSSINSSMPLYPILVIIHGGAFEVGSTRIYDPREMGERFVRRDILVITVQYRLGVLGFASSGDKVMPGNLGLWDLVQALRWIRAEIANFGGDARRVTVQGYSAGAAAVSALGMSPYGRHLFHQSIQMSGSMLAATKIGAFVANETRELAKALECPNIDDSMALKECLRAKTIEQIHDGIDKIGPTRSDVNFAKFSTREDGHFFPRELLELIHESTPKRTIIGHCRLDSLLYTLIQSKNDSVTQYAVPRDRIEHFGQHDFEYFIRQVVAKEQYFGVKEAPKVQEEIIEFFTRKFKVPVKKDNKFFLQRYSMVLSDLQYVMPAMWESRLKANWNWPLFLYEFIWSEAKLFAEHVKVQEAFHTLDHDLLFGGGKKQLESAEAREVSQILVEAIANFVHSGNPSSKNLLWLPATFTDPMRHLAIDGVRPKMRNALDDLERLKFWHRLTETHNQFNLIKGAYGPKEAHDEL